MSVSSSESAGAGLAGAGAEETWDNRRLANEL